MTSRRRKRKNLKWVKRFARPEQQGASGAKDPAPVSPLVRVSNYRRFYLVFFIVHTVLVSVYLDAALNYGTFSTRKTYGVFPNANVISRALPIEPLATKGSFEITEHHGITIDKANVRGHYYSDKAPLPTLIAVPVYATLKFFGQLDSLTFVKRLFVAIGIGGFFAGVLPFVGVMLLCLRDLIERQNLKLQQAIWLSTLPFYGSFLFVFAGGYFNHLLAAGFMLLALQMLRSRRFGAAGVLAGLACLSEYTLAFLGLCWALVLVRREMRLRPLFAFAAGAVPAALALLGYNAITTGDPLIFLYKYSVLPTTHTTTYGFGLPTWASLWGLTFGTKVGLFLYVPALLPIGLAALRQWSAQWHNIGWHQTIGGLISRSYIVFPLLAYFLLISGYGQWDGGVSFGPRHLTVFAMLGLFIGIPLVATSKLTRRVLWGVLAIGLPFFWLARNTLGYATKTDIEKAWHILTVDQTPTNMVSLFTGIPPLEVGIVWPFTVIICTLLLGRYTSNGSWIQLIPILGLTNVNKRRLYYSAALALCLLLAYVVTYPLVGNLGGLLANYLGQNQIRVGDALMFVQYLEQAKAAMIKGLPVVKVLFRDPTFEMPPTYLYPGALLSFVVGSVVAHNLFMLFCVFLATVCMFCFCFRLTQNWIGSAYAAITFGSSNYMVHHIVDGHGNLVQLYLLPVVFLFVELLVEAPKLRHALFLGVSVALLIVSTPQYALYIALLLPIYIVARRPEWYKEKEFIQMLALSVVTSIILSGYYLYLKMGLSVQVYSIELNLHYSLHNLTDLVHPGREAHLGSVSLLLALMAIFRISSPDRNKIIALFLVVIVSVILSFGPWHTYAPYTFFYRYAPFFNQVRTPIRFITIALTATCALSAIGIAHLSRIFSGARKAIILATIFAATFFTHYFLATPYYQRAPQPNSIWIVHVKIPD